MNYKERLDRLDGVFAYDSGCASSGIKDDDFKRRLMGDTDGETEKLLTDLAKQYLNSDQGYTLEDVKVLIDWSERELNWVF